MVFVVVGRGIRCCHRTIPSISLFLEIVIMLVFPNNVHIILAFVDKSKFALDFYIKWQISLHLGYEKG
jgi:tellurite resistance-related uncharacterized protein